MTITIYNSARPEAEKKLTAIEKKAKKYGCKFGFTFGEPYAKEITIYSVQYNYADHCTELNKDGTQIVEAVDLTIDSYDLIRKDGWTAIAQLEHFDNGNLVTRFYDREDPIPDEWRTRKPYCEHCHSNRERKVTYLVQDPTGTIRQVGSSCLHDYTGIDPRTAIAFAELWDDIISKECDPSHYDPDRESANLIYNVERVIGLAVDSINRDGYHKADDLHPTKHAVSMAINENIRPTPEGAEKAAKITEWLKTTDDKDSLIQDCAVLAKNEYCKHTHFGRLAYIPVAYDKVMARLEAQRRRDEQNALAAKTSHHMGAIGERMTFHIESFEYVTSWETVYGTTNLYKFTTTDGNVLVWFASSTFGYWTDREWHHYTPEEVHTIKATVKDHTERDGIKQTVITRCKVS